MAQQVAELVAEDAGTLVYTGLIAASVATKSWDPDAVADGTVTSTTVTVTGAKLGDFALASFSLAVAAGGILAAQVTAADTVTVTLFNKTGSSLDLAAGTLSAMVFTKK